MTKFCPECGTQQRDDSVKYCSNCGFDFSKLENKIEGQGINQESIKIDIEGSDDTGSNNSSSSSVQGSNNSSPKASTTRINDSTKSSSAGQIKNTSSSSNILSSLSFNKCLVACLVLFIFLAVLGMIVEFTEPEPFSDRGLTSFMESSGNNDYNSYLQDSDYYDNSNYDSDYDSDYLSYSILSVHTNFL